jgi:hypothetical protein
MTFWSGAKIQGPGDAMDACCFLAEGGGASSGGGCGGFTDSCELTKWPMLYTLSRVTFHLFPGEIIHRYERVVATCRIGGFLVVNIGRRWRRK